MSLALAGRFLTTRATWEALKPSSKPSSCAFFYTDAFDLYLDLFTQTRFWASPQYASLRISGSLLFTVWTGTNCQPEPEFGVP